MDDGADGAARVANSIMVTVDRRRCSSAVVSGFGYTGSRRREILGVDMAEGQRELERKREQRHPTAKPSPCSNPTHHD